MQHRAGAVANIADRLAFPVVAGQHGAKPKVGGHVEDKEQKDGHDTDLYLQLLIPEDC